MKLFETWDNLFEGREDWIKENLGDKIIEAMKSDTTMYYEQEKLLDAYIDYGEDSAEYVHERDKILHYLVSGFKAIDPTPNSKYIQWIAMRYINNEFLFKEDREVVADNLETFHEFKKYLDKKDINQYKSLADLREAIRKFKETTHDDIAEQHMIQKGDIAVIYEKNGQRILIPKTYKASRYLAKDKHGTSWCTAYPGAYESHTKNGTLFIIEGLDEEKGPFQIHFESRQYMDRNDRRIEIEEYINKYESIQWLVDGYYHKKVLNNIDKLLTQLRNGDRLLKRYVSNAREFFTLLKEKYPEYLFANGVLDALDETRLFKIDTDFVRMALSTMEAKEAAKFFHNVEENNYEGFKRLEGPNLEDEYLDIIISDEANPEYAFSTLVYLFDDARAIDESSYLKYTEKLVSKFKEDGDNALASNAAHVAMNDVFSQLLRNFKSLSTDGLRENSVQEYFVNTFNQIKELYESHKELSIWALHLIVTEDALPINEFDEWIWNFFENESKDVDLPRWFYRAVTKANIKEGWDALYGFMKTRANEFSWRSNIKERVINSLEERGYEI